MGRQIRGKTILKIDINKLGQEENAMNTNRHKKLTRAAHLTILSIRSYGEKCA